MSAGLYVNDGGVTRKIKKLYTNVGGVARELKELWVNDGGVSRRIFSAYDCKMEVYSTSLSKGLSVKISREPNGHIYYMFSGSNDSNKGSIIVLRYTFDQPIDFTRYGDGLSIRVNIYDDGYSYANYTLDIGLTDQANYTFEKAIAHENITEAKQVNVSSRRDISCNVLYLAVAGIVRNGAWIDLVNPIFGGRQLTNIELI